MKEIEFTEEQLGNLQQIADTLFSDEQDPRSPNYKRTLMRPTICWSRIIVAIVLVLVSTQVLYVLLDHFGVPRSIVVTGCILFPAAAAACCLKRILICIVQIYQRYAPASIRNKCRFEPSCSEYMILSLQKYGLCKGLAKGIDRLRRCNINDGGFDSP